jgi:hypothetical protein
VGANLMRMPKDESGKLWAAERDSPATAKRLHSGGFWLDGAAQESNLPSVGLRRRTGFEDQLGHRPQPLRGGH